MKNGDIWMKRDARKMQSQVACQTACPVGTDARSMVISIRDGEYLEAYRIARLRNPFSMLCGAVCPAPCEISCSLKRFGDAAVSIRALEKYVNALYGPSSIQSENVGIKYVARSQTESKEKRIAVIGGGITGLTAAHDLSLMGYHVTVFEADGFLGGFYTKSVPGFKVDPRAFQREVRSVCESGFEVRLNHRVNGLEEAVRMLDEGFQAICLTTGPSIRKPDDFPRNAIDSACFIYKYIHSAQPPLSGGCVVIPRIDVSGELDLAACDAARLAVRIGAFPVYLGASGGSHLFESTSENLSDAEDEGIILTTRDEALDLANEAPLVVASCSEVPAFEGLSGCVSAIVSGVFAAGPASVGRCMLPESIAAGSHAARDINAYLTAQKVGTLTASGLFPINLDAVKLSLCDRDDTLRALPDKLPVDARAANMDAVEFEYSEKEAKRQASRCFDCRINTVVDESRCTLSGKCVRVCPTNCIDLVPLGGSGRMVLVQDNSRCERCGLCVEACQPRAISLSAFEWEEYYVDADSAAESK